MRVYDILGKESRMWITSEVEIPDELIDHLEQGKLVLFVGREFL